ncbi:ankyrin [Coniophora puteana RWD-64-598 SS2]|uniref:Ankyrin n=1 Tax=Coniophora puteana (strain RWD-64-598) TaxID=741705 RepID=A0A5M3MS03_CONPW|nr:ankyrin [Coniophora puteana RWD-64-598 SS2]EIW81880.1 ankyrin [Coniophora puteana RWD-64-598 SS2]
MYSPSNEIQTFLKRISSLPDGPGAGLDDALQPALDYEADLRRLFATERDSSILKDPYVGLVDVFAVPNEARLTRERVVKNDDDKIAKFVMPLNPEKRRKEGVPSTVKGLDEFKANFNVFTENSLSLITDWSNIVVAGGSILACLSPLPDEAAQTRRTLRKWFHAEATPTSDIDMFLYGLTPTEAEKKIDYIYRMVRDAIPWDVTCVRTKHTVSIHSQYPYRAIQIVLRLYQSPAEILAGFDIDAPCCLYDGNKVWVNPRSLIALMRQCNTVDMTRRSPSYEVRLAKYAARGFEVYIPSLRRADIDPTIFERSIARVAGLARLLALESLRDSNIRDKFIEERRNLRGRPYVYRGRSNRQRRYKGDLKGLDSFFGLEMNDYDVSTLHIPYGPRWNAQRIENLIYTADIKMNSIWNPKNKDRKLHRHPAFFGTAAECLEDCCEACPETGTDEERALLEKDDENYIRGRVTFIHENPGRQSITGSFRPIDDGEWSELAYIADSTKFFHAVAHNDTTPVAQMISDGMDANRRDHAGRTPLHLAVLSGSVDVALQLIESGTRVSARIVDGRSALHLAAAGNHVQVIEKLLERSKGNEEEARKKADEEKQAGPKDESRAMSHDGKEDGKEDDNMDGEKEDEDWDEVDDDGSDTKEKKSKDGDLDIMADAVDLGAIPEDESSLPDILDINAPDWDAVLTPIGYAVMSGSADAVKALISSGADIKTAIKGNSVRDRVPLPLKLTRFVEDSTIACKIAKALLEAGASSTAIDDQPNMLTVLHEHVMAGKLELIQTFLENDPNAKKALEFPSKVNYELLMSPLASAVQEGRYDIVILLLAWGAKLELSENDVARAQQMLKKTKQYIRDPMQSADVLGVSLANVHWDLALSLVKLGADPNSRLVDNDWRATHRTILDWTMSTDHRIAKQLDEQSKSDDESSVPALSSQPSAWEQEYVHLVRKLVQAKKSASDPEVDRAKDEQERKTRQIREISRAHLGELRGELVSAGAKTCKELHPDDGAADDASSRRDRRRDRREPENVKYEFLPTYSWNSDGTPPKSSYELYDQLFDACYTGDDAKVIQLCLQPPKGRNALRISVHIPLPLPGQYGGYTPLFAAVMGRKWTTAKLILDIARKQYVKEDVSDNKVNWHAESLQLDESDMGDSEDEMDVDDDEVPPSEEPHIIDIKDIPSEVQCKSPPENLLTLSYKIPSNSQEEGGLSYSSIVCQAAQKNDRESLEKILDLYDSCEGDFGDEVMSSIASVDNPAILDIVIRRYGVGIDIPKESDDDWKEAKATNGRRPYLGLTVHGEKRTDLAKKVEGNSSEDTSEHRPMLYILARETLPHIVEYLGSEGILTSYRAYIDSHEGDDNKKISFLRTACESLETLRSHLGWTESKTGENSLTAALCNIEINKALPVLEAMFRARPDYMKNLVNKTLVKRGYNSILMAVMRNCNPALFNFLRNKGASYMERSATDRANVLHMVCSTQNTELFEHFIQKLPRADLDELLVQRAGSSKETPLHVAVSKGNLQFVEQLTKLGGPSLTARNLHGSTPLHLAISLKLHHIVCHLVSALPPKELRNETAFGETPFELAVRQKILEDVQSRNSVRCLNLTSTTEPSFGDEYLTRDLWEKRAATVRGALARLAEGKHLDPNAQLATEAAALAKRLEDKAAACSEIDKAKSQDRNSALTLAVLKEAGAAVPGQRVLVHVHDVLESMSGTIEVVKKKQGQEDKEQNERERDKAFGIKRCRYDYGEDQDFIDGFFVEGMWV